MIGLYPDELPWLRMLVELLRHPDPLTSELTRQALVYLKQSADQDRLEKWRPVTALRRQQPLT